MESVNLQSNFQEVGAPGLNAFAGYVNEAYNRELYWPDVAPVYNRIWRSDPEASVARVIQGSMAAKLSVSFDTHPSVEKPSDDDKRAVEFGNEVLEDMQGGITRWITSCAARVPFYGWGWWEVVPGLRRKGWRPPSDDGWRSEYDDGLVGVHKLAFRHYSSFYSWDMDDKKVILRGMMQNDPPNPIVTIPTDRSLHVTFGDPDNPEGLATMEAMWRLERYKHNLEMVQGIGFEHSAGIAKFTTDGDLDESAKTIIRNAARAIMMAQEGNYMALPNKIESEILDVDFSAAEQIINAIRYYGILKLALLGMQWAALGTLSPYGSYSSIKDANEFYLNVFNSMVEGFVNQADQQVGRRLYDNPVNAAAFPGMTRRPVLAVSRAQKTVDLDQLGAFMQAMTIAGMALDNDDWVAVRRKSDFLPETMPETAVLPVVPTTETTDDESSVETAEDEAVEESNDEDAGEGMLAMPVNLQDSVMAAFFVPDDVGEALQLEGVPGALSPYEMHVTLAFMGDVGSITDRIKVERALVRFARAMPPIAAEVNGAALFNNPGERALVALVDSPDLPGFRAALLETLSRVGVNVDRTHGFIPHVTLAYLPEDYEIDVRDVAAEPSGMTFDKVYLAWGREVVGFDLTGERRDLTRRPFVVDAGEDPIDVMPLADEVDDVEATIRKFKKWAEENDPALVEFLNAETRNDGNEPAA
jgi:2'-5' RNA ligase